MEQWHVPGYRELEELGTGNQGRVVLAVRPDGGMEVAIKYLAPTLLSDARSAAAFRREAEALARLTHPNVARVLHYQQGPSGAAIVMEAVRGRSLREILYAHGSMPPESALALFRGSLLGLAAAHHAGVVHGDYKPSNMIVQPDGASKLIDFGIAILAGQTLWPDTPSYMAPERWQGHPASRATDIYSATCVFYECLTGVKPYTADGLQDLMHQHLSAPVPAHVVPDPVRPLLRRGMAKDPDQRISDVSWFVAQLEAAADTAYGPGWRQRGVYALAKVAAGLTGVQSLAVVGGFKDLIESAGNLAATSGNATGMPSGAPSAPPSWPAQPDRPGGVRPHGDPLGGLQPGRAERYYAAPPPGTRDMAGKAAAGGKAAKTALITVTSVVGVGLLIAGALYLRDDPDSMVRPQAAPTRKVDVGGTATGTLSVRFRKPGPMVTGTRGPSGDYQYTVTPARVSAGTKVTVTVIERQVSVRGDYRWAIGSDRWDMFAYPTPPARPGRIPPGQGVHIRADKEEVISPERRFPIDGGATGSTETTRVTFNVPRSGELPPGRYLLTTMTPPRITELEAYGKPIPPSAVGGYTTGALPVITVLPAPDPDVREARPRAVPAVCAIPCRSPAWTPRPGRVR
jgi:hypothetical protein